MTNISEFPVSIAIEADDEKAALLKRLAPTNAPDADGLDAFAPQAIDLAQALAVEPEIYPVFSPAFDITFNFTDGNTSYAATANAAAAFWELAITGDQPDFGGVDDLRINAHLGLIGYQNGSDGQGSVLANAGPREIRSGSFIAYTGEMGIDPADASNAGLQSIIVHEIGHILGLPFTARQKGFITDAGDDNRYIGSNALAEYRLLSNNSTASFVPLQADTIRADGGRSEGGHWDEATFGRELMTPQIDTTQLAPLSRMTLASLRDFGYSVDLGYSDPFTLSSTPSALRDDLSGNFNTNTTIAMNSSLSRTIEQSEDNDWFRVSLTSGVSYTFEMNGAPTGAGTLANSYLAIRSLDGGILAFNDDNGTNANSRIVYTATTTGTYFLDASALGLGTGTYTLAVATTARGSVGSIAIDDISIVEGNAGTSVATFTVTRSGGTGAFTVNYATSNGTATSGSDYVATSGTLSFAAGVNSQTVSVTINGDTLFEQNETFFLNLSGATNGATITDSQAIATILNDEIQAGSIAINDVSIVEGNAGISVATFTVTRSGGTGAFAVNYNTSSGTASSNDYLATSGTLTFATGVMSQTISVQVYGDNFIEPDETFFVNLLNATNGATIADGQGVGTIVDDDVRDDFADSLTDRTAPLGTVTAGGTATGELETTGDRDVFRVQLTAGARYVIDLSGSSTDRGSLSDPYLRLRDTSGSVIAQNDDSGPGLDSQLFYTATASGLYYVEAGAFDDSAKGTYRISVSGDVTPDPDRMPLVDDRYYNARNPDVAAAGVDPERHYSEAGWREGRDPNPFFSTVGYLAANTDVRVAGVNPLAHYDSDGWREGRDPSARFDNELYLARNADVAQAGIDPLAHFLANGQAEGRQSYAAIGRAGDITSARGFDAEYYLLNNTDVARAAINSGTSDSFAFAYQHYQINGWHEGRNPNAVFDVNGYLAAYGDVRAANIDPLAHYDNSGWREGRDPSVNFDTTDYRAAYRDVANANIDPMTHYLTNGIYENRSAFADGHFG